MTDLDDDLAIPPVGAPDPYVKRECVGGPWHGVNLTMPARHDHIMPNPADMQIKRRPYYALQADGLLHWQGDDHVSVNVDNSDVKAVDKR